MPLNSKLLIMNTIIENKNYLKKAWCSTQHFQRCLQACLEGVSKPYVLSSFLTKQSKVFCIFELRYTLCFNFSLLLYSSSLLIYCYNKNYRYMYKQSIFFLYRTWIIWDDCEYIEKDSIKNYFPLDSPCILERNNHNPGMKRLF